MSNYIIEKNLVNDFVHLWKCMTGDYFEECLECYPYFI